MPRCALPDSGSEVSLVTDTLARQYGLQVEEDPAFRVHTAVGLSAPLQRVVGSVQLTLKGEDNATRSWALAECWVVPGPQLFDLLIGTGCLARYHYVLDTGRQRLGLWEPGQPTATPVIQVPLQHAVASLGLPDASMPTAAAVEVPVAAPPMSPAAETPLAADNE